MAGGGNAEGEFGFQIAPMLDILFVLLLFFMVSAGAQKHEAGLTTQLPGSGGPAGNIPVAVNIDEDGQVNVSGAPIDTPVDPELPQLVQRLEGHHGLQPRSQQPIVITPSRSTHQQRVVDVLQRVRRRPSQKSCLWNPRGLGENHGPGNSRTSPAGALSESETGKGKALDRKDLPLGLFLRRSDAAPRRPVHAGDVGDLSRPSIRRRRISPRLTFPASSPPPPPPPPTETVQVPTHSVPNPTTTITAPTAAPSFSVPLPDLSPASTPVSVTQTMTQPVASKSNAISSARLSKIMQTEAAWGRGKQDILESNSDPKNITAKFPVYLASYANGDWYCNNVDVEWPDHGRQPA